MKNSQMNARVFVEYDKESVRPGPEFKCSECGTWFKKLIYWTSKKFNPNQKYGIIMLCGPRCALEAYGKSRTSET